MSPSDLADLFDNNPNKVYRLTLCSGDQVIVKNPRLTLFDSLQLFIGQTDDPTARVGQRTKIVSIPNIAMVEEVDPRLPANGRGRRRR